jgi:hypothetical protein
MSDLQTKCLSVLPMKPEMVEEQFENGSFIERTLCLSHERFRAELSGAEIVIRDMEKSRELATQLAGKMKSHAWLARLRNAKLVPGTSEGDVRLSPFVANQIAGFIDELIVAVLCGECSK